MASYYTRDMLSVTSRSLLAQLLEATVGAALIQEARKIRLANQPYFEALELFRWLDQDTKGYVSFKDISKLISQTLQSDPKWIRLNQQAAQLGLPNHTLLLYAFSWLDQLKAGQVTRIEFISYLLPQTDPSLKNLISDRLERPDISEVSKEGMTEQLLLFSELFICLGQFCVQSLSIRRQLLEQEDYSMKAILNCLSTFRDSNITPEDLHKFLLNYGQGNCSLQECELLCELMNHELRGKINGNQVQWIIQCPLGSWLADYEAKTIRQPKARSKTTPKSKAQAANQQVQAQKDSKSIPKKYRKNQRMENKSKVGMIVKAEYSKENRSKRQYSQAKSFNQKPQQVRNRSESQPNKIKTDSNTKVQQREKKLNEIKVVYPLVASSEVPNLMPEILAKMKRLESDHLLKDQGLAKKIAQFQKQTEVLAKSRRQIQTGSQFQRSNQKEVQSYPFTPSRHNDSGKKQYGQTDRISHTEHGYSNKHNEQVVSVHKVPLVQNSPGNNISQFNPRDLPLQGRIQTSQRILDNSRRMRAQLALEQQNRRHLSAFSGPSYIGTGINSHSHLKLYNEVSIPSSKFGSEYIPNQSMSFGAKQIPNALPGYKTPGKQVYGNSDVKAQPSTSSKLLSY